MAKQTLTIQTVYFADSDRKPAVELGGELYDTLTRPRAERLGFGPGIPVWVGVSASRVELQAATNVVIVPMLGPRAFADQAMRDLVIARIAAWHDQLGPGHVVPVMLAPAWRNVEDRLPGVSILHRVLPSDAASWLPVVIDVVLAASRLLGDPANSATIFVSHAKRDLAATGRLAEQLAHLIHEHTTGDAFFDATHLRPGQALAAQLAAATTRGVFVAVHGDSYASRPWCERELLSAKRAGLPTLTVLVHEKGEQRSYPYGGNAPTVVWTPGTGVEHIVLRAMVEWLRSRHFALDAVRFCADAPSLVVLPRPPELLDLAQGPLIDPAATVVMHPDPEVSRAERQVLREVRPRMRLVTPSTSFRGLELRHPRVAAPLYRREIALSLSDSPDVGGPDGFTSDHVADATVFLARALVSAGAAIAYGGDLRTSGYDELLADVIVAYNGSGQAAADFLISYLPATSDPDAPGAVRDDLALTVRSLLRTTPYCEAARLPAPSGTATLVERALYLSEVRAAMAEHGFARVVLGGQSEPRRDGAEVGYIGAYPGILEEAWWMLERGRPIYVAGGFGGAAGLLAGLLDGRTPPAPLRAETFADDARYVGYRERAEEFARSTLRERAGAPRDLAALVAGLRAHASHLSSDSAALAWNGLTVAENRALFRTRDHVELTRLVMQGLHHKASAATEGKLAIELIRGSIARVEDTDAIAIATYANIPVGGAAAAIDRAMSGRVTAAIHAGRTVLPIPSHELDADWLVLGHLGALVAGDLAGVGDAIETCATQVAAIATRNAFRNLAIVTFGTSANDDLADVVTRMIRGLALLRDRCTIQWFEIQLATYDRLGALLEAIPDVSLSRRELADGARSAPIVARDVVVTTRYADEALHATILPPEGRAAAIAIRTSLSADAFAAIAQSSAAVAPILDAPACEALVTALLGAAGRGALGQLTGHRLVVQHDLATAALPFEAFGVNGHRYSLAHGVVRRPALHDIPLAVPRPVRQGALVLLLIVDPTRDLQGARAEAAAVRAALDGSNHIRVRVLDGAAATRDAVLAGLADPAVDVFHYCGHAFYDGPEPDASGLVCAGGARVTGVDVAALGTTPRVAFFNACRSARVRDLAPHTVPAPAVDVSVYTRAFAGHFLRGGTEAYVGTLWPVDDVGAARFATEIYSGLARGGTLGSALALARNALASAGHVDWANYVLYGDGSFAVVR